MIGCVGEGSNNQVSVKENVTAKNIKGFAGADIQFDTLINNLGQIIAGEQVLCYYKYRNTGDEPLLIQSIKAGCGCTVPEWNMEPLQPNEAGVIKVMFDSFSKRGNQNIRITVNSNARTAVSTLFLKAEVNENQ